MQCPCPSPTPPHTVGTLALCSTTVTTQLGEAAALQCPPPGLQPARRQRVEDTVTPFVQDWVFGWEQVSHDEAMHNCCEVH